MEAFPKRLVELLYQVSHSYTCTQLKLELRIIWSWSKSTKLGTKYTITKVYCTDLL